MKDDMNQGKHYKSISLGFECQAVKVEDCSKCKGVSNETLSKFPCKSREYLEKLT